MSRHWRKGISSPGANWPTTSYDHPCFSSASLRHRLFWNLDARSGSETSWAYGVHCVATISAFSLKKSKANSTVARAVLAPHPEKGRKEPGSRTRQHVGARIDVRQSGDDSPVTHEDDAAFSVTRQFREDSHEPAGRRVFETEGLAAGGRRSPVSYSSAIFLQRRFSSRLLNLASISGSQHALGCATASRHRAAALKGSGSMSGISSSRKRPRHCSR